VIRPRPRLEADRRTMALAVLAGGTVLAVLAGELGRVWHRGSAPLPRETDHVLTAAEEAVVETAQVAKAGYQEVSGRENAMFNLLTSFVATFLSARFVTFRLRRSSRVGPFRDLQLGRRRIHHFVPGIVLAFASGGGAIVTRNEDIEPLLAVPFGVGLGLTLDESALLLDLEDVYWTREGLLSVQITLAVMSLLAAVALGLRFLRRGEELLLEAEDADPASSPAPG
jgi:hypothetical protein